MKSQIIWIYNNHLDNFLWQQGLRPEVEEEHRSGYRRCKELFTAIESYDIRYRYFKNRHN